MAFAPPVCSLLNINVVSLILFADSYFRVGSAARQLRAFFFSQSVWKAWAHSLARRWSLVEALLSRPSVSKPSVSSRMDFIKVSSEQLTPPPFPPHLDGLFIDGAWRAERFFGLHLPAWPSDSCSGCQLVALGTLRRTEFSWKGETKRGRGLRGLCRHVRVFSLAKLSLSSKSKNKKLSLSLLFLRKIAVK